MIGAILKILVFALGSARVDVERNPSSYISRTSTYRSLNQDLDSYSILDYDPNPALDVIVFEDSNRDQVQHTPASRCSVFIIITDLNHPNAEAQPPTIFLSRAKCTGISSYMLAQCAGNLLRADAKINPISVFPRSGSRPPAPRGKISAAASRMTSRSPFVGVSSCDVLRTHVQPPKLKSSQTDENGK
ncbi:hypothetical protein EVAR_35941_1 [Eumeta japonica]|uniref:Uncharacterized protein n=1 Tax=Eumeta variegata TaxID=151549 RepID=A0A4C1W3U4_EUMVA|nr:hypothetical protein EVAR_35941_1 [Eumeta japonica]